MKERPVNMRAEEVRAILDGRKTQFRRVIKEQPDYVNRCGVPFYPDGGGPIDYRLSPFGVAGDRLWVRETTWWRFDGLDDNVMTGYVADGGPVRSGQHREAMMEQGPHYKVPSIHMPRKFSRITLEVASVRVERLNEISEEDAKSEWCSPLSERCRRTPVCGSDDWPEFHGTHRDNFRCWWGSIYGPRSWDENPWVWVVDFKVIKGGAQ